MDSYHEYPTGPRLVMTLLSLFLGTFLVAIDTTIVSVAIPEISTAFHALNDVGWYGSAYLITITALQPAGGTIYQLFNAKSVYLSAIVVFEAGSALCAAAPNSPVFILGRAIAGSGAALLIQGAISVITQICSLEKRPLYIGLVVSCFGISASFSPVLGGALTSRVSWRWCFWINLPIGAAIFLLVLFGLKVKSTKENMGKLSAMEKLKQLDLLGVVLLLSSVSCLFLALQWAGSSFSWSSSKIIGLMTGFGTLLITFGLLQWRLQERATIPLRIVRQRTVLFGASALFFISMSSNIKLYYLPFYFQAVRSASALRSGVDFLALAVPQVVATIMAGGLATKTGHYVVSPAQACRALLIISHKFSLILAGAIICSVGTGLLIRLDITSSTVVWVISLVVAGFGDGMCTNMPYTAIQAIIENEKDVFIGNGKPCHRSNTDFTVVDECMFTAIATFATLAGGAIGISIGNNILISELRSGVPQRTGMPAERVIEAGALNLGELTKSSTVLHELRQAYGHAISAVMICATVAICVSILATLGMQRLNLVKISRDREAAKVMEPTTPHVIVEARREG
ncbi:MAG: hypothetical protein Q9224_001844 [Gallowayella concinna]